MFSDTLNNSCISRHAGKGSVHAVTAAVDIVHPLLGSNCPAPLAPYPPLPPPPLMYGPAPHPPGLRPLPGGCCWALGARACAWVGPTVGGALSVCPPPGSPSGGGTTGTRGQVEAGGCSRVGTGGREGAGAFEMQERVRGCTDLACNSGTACGMGLWGWDQGQAWPESWRREEGGGQKNKYPPPLPPPPVMYGPAPNPQHQVPGSPPPRGRCLGF